MKAGLMSDGGRIEIEVKAALAGWSLNRRFVRPRYSVSPADYLQRSCDDLTRTPKKLKTYRRIFDTIFFGGLAKMQDATHQRLAMETAPEKPRKRKKKCFFLLLKHPIFCQKGQKKALFFCQYVLFKSAMAAWALMAWHLQKFQEPRFFRQRNDNAPSSSKLKAGWR